VVIPYILQDKLNEFAKKTVWYMDIIFKITLCISPDELDTVTNRVIQPIWISYSTVYIHLTASDLHIIIQTGHLLARPYFDKTLTTVCSFYLFFNIYGWEGCKKLKGVNF
jgi:hypothetical protein